MTDDLYEEFVAQIDRTGGRDSCHVWTGPRYPNKGGYGRFRRDGAHRVAYALKHGDIPEGAIVRHSCDNPPCCNPAHLLLGGHSDNRKDCVSRGRHAKGQMHARSKLTHRQVRFIRTHHKGCSHIEIAKKYGVSRSTITKILLGSTYQGVGQPRFARPENAS